jgi:cytochrome c oxidase assembly protein subunit 15
VIAPSLINMRPMNYSKTNFYIYVLASLLAYCVIVLGAYTRLSDAGLGCPDWPGCYGEFFVPEGTDAMARANEAFPERPLEKSKAWKEMVHRYAAETLGLLILFLTIKSWVSRAKGRPTQLFAPNALLVMVIFQGALGMWTVTLLLKPVIVTAHLLGGMSILALLYWLSITAFQPLLGYKRSRLTPWVAAGLVLVFCQIALGGWTSANYSALICTDFPTCQGQWWPQMDFREGFTLWRGLGVDYEGGVLDAMSRTAVHVTHRVGALLTFLAIGSLAVSAFMMKNQALRRCACVVMFVLLTQISLGIANVLLVLPLPVAVAHNAVAALLVLSLITLLYFSYSKNGNAEN